MEAILKEVKYFFHMKKIIHHIYYGEIYVSLRGDASEKERGEK